ncbi:MAG TPA: hypothetical protein VKB72_14805 [Steroidobacteraceae bacterium]|nr:hypothetical protein [Steroidobacteraceae bacterium]
MAASAPGEMKPARRPALWPYLVMPLIVLLVFWALHRVQHPRQPVGPPAPLTGASPATPQE